MQESELFDGFAGGGALPPDMAHPKRGVKTDFIVSSELDKQLARLLLLHPDLQVKFRSNNIASLDEDTKRQLLEDMREILGIRPLNYEETHR